MSNRIGGSFPGDKTGRPERSERPRGTGRPGGDRRPSFGGGSRPDRPGGSSGYSSRPRPGADVDRDRERPERRRDDRRGSTSDLPRIPDSITDDQVSREVRDELGSLTADRAGIVGRYLIAAELATDPEQAYRYAQAAKQLAARVGIVREVSGIMAYKSGRWAEALTELQAGRRMTGRNDYLPLMADSERGLGRLDRALDLVHSAEAKRLPRAAQIELRIVESGIRRDQGLADAAVLALQVPELTDGKQRPWSGRLFYAYGEALLAANRPRGGQGGFLPRRRRGRGRADRRPGAARRAGRHQRHRPRRRRRDEDETLDDRDEADDLDDETTTTPTTTTTTRRQATTTSMTRTRTTRTTIESSRRRRGRARRRGGRAAGPEHGRPGEEPSERARRGTAE